MKRVWALLQHFKAHTPTPPQCWYMHKMQEIFDTAFNISLFFRLCILEDLMHYAVANNIIWTKTENHTKKDMPIKKK